MHVSFLDHKLLEFAASLPGSYKVKGFHTKYFAKRALASTFLTSNTPPKKGRLPVPYHTWMRTGMNEWIRDLLF